VATDLTVDFTDASTDSDGTVEQWSWDFGDGATSTEQNPSHTYGEAGDHTVTLTVTDNDGATRTTTQTVSVTLSNQAPTADFTWAATDLTVDFTDASSDPDGTIEEWSWDLGDGATSTEQNPSHTFAADGSYAVTLTVTDNDGATDTKTQTVSVASGGGDGLEVRVAAGSDDAEEAASGSMTVGSTDLELVFDGSDQKVAMRFNGMTIPRGATISNAHIQFTMDEVQSVATSLSIQGQATDDAATFTTSSGNISSRSRTVSSVSWSPAPWTTVGAAGPDQRTPNIASVIQEIVNRPGWSSDNSLVVIISGTGHRTAESYNGMPGAAPLLHVEYTVGSNQAPTADFTWVATDLTVDFTDASSDPDGAVVEWSWDFGDGGTSTAQNPSHTYAAAGDYTVALTVIDNDGAAGSTTRTVTVTAATSETLYITSSDPGSVGGISFEDEDILAYDSESDAWSMYFDGSDVGLDGSTKHDVRAFALLSNGDILLTVNGQTNVPGVGAVDASDIVRFSGSTGPTTSGSFSLYLRGADVGLNNEAIDAIGFAPDGRLVISTTGSFNVPGASGADEDLIALDAGGSSWSLYFDGSDVGLTSSAEDVAGVWIDDVTGDVYLTAAGSFAVSGVSGGSADVFVCTPDALGSSTSCSFTSYWVGSTHGLTSNDVVGIHIGGGN
jgi:PKD repeat protein